MNPIITFQSIPYKKITKEEGLVYIDYRHKKEIGRLIYVNYGMFIYLPNRFKTFLYNKKEDKILFVEDCLNENGNMSIKNLIEISNTFIEELEEGEYLIDELMVQKLFY